MRIETGAAEDHPTLLPLDASMTPGVAPVTQTAGSAPGQGGVMDTTGMYQAQTAEAEAEVRAAQLAGQAAEDDRRSRYQAQALPVGGSIGDAMDLPPVPANAVTAESYPKDGDEPIPMGG